MPSSTLDDLADAYTRVSAQNHEALVRFVEIGTMLQRQGIDFLLLKGADLLTRLYGAIGLRPMTDVDLLLHESDLPRAEAILLASGFSREIDGNPAYRLPDGSLLLDIGTTIWYLDQSGIEGIWARTVQRMIHTLPVRCMNRNDLLLYLAAYAVLYRGCCSPTFAKDLALLAKQESIDWPSVADEALRWNLKIPLYHGLSAATTYESLSIPAPILNGLAPSRIREKALLRILRTFVTDQPIPHIGHALLWLTRPRGQTWRWVKGYLWPSERFLLYRYGEAQAGSPWRTRLFRLKELMGELLLLTARMLSRLLNHGGPR